MASVALLACDDVLPAPPAVATAALDGEVCQTFVRGSGPNAVYDTFLREDQPTYSGATSGGLAVGHVVGGGEHSRRRALIGFDLATLDRTLPVTRATLTLVTANSIADVDVRVEAPLTWNFAETASWETDADDAALGHEVAQFVLPKTTYNWQTTTVDLNLTGTVAGWVADPDSNHGLMFVGADETAYAVGNIGASDMANTAYRPRLTVCQATSPGAVTFGEVSGGMGGSPVQLPGGGVPIPSVTPAWTKVSTYLMETCALTNLGKIACWGMNDEGQLGDGSTVAHLTPKYIASSASYASVTAGQRHVCARQTDGTVWCWGSDANNQCADSPPPFPAPPVHHEVPSAVDPWSTGWSQLSAGDDATCAVHSDGVITCWGFDAGFGSFGTGSLSDGNGYFVPAIPNGWFNVQIGITHACGLRANGVLDCWGDNTVGELGDNTTNSALYPVAVAGGMSWLSFDVSRLWSKFFAQFPGNMHTCAVRSGDRTLWCWGANGHGQLGDGTLVARLMPHAIYGSATAGQWKAVATGGAHTCGIKMNGTLWCWGLNSHGQLGDGTFVDRTSPKQVGAATNWASVATGVENTCAVTTNGKLFCWGMGKHGAVGNGGFGDVTLPAAIALP